MLLLRDQKFPLHWMKTGHEGQAGTFQSRECFIYLSMMFVNSHGISHCSLL